MYQTHDIQYLNLSYLLLLQRVSFNKDASLITGIDNELLETIKELPLQKLISIAETHQFIISIRKDIILD
ncbi:flagellar transcriptional regulator FlhD [Enterobacter roggenkampii]|uniref:flagellar transcriptional regulator FlhD n=1 Tax=Enterobacter roggenkampii TaxID=1812935 RepID=UPI00398BAF8A